MPRNIHKGNNKSREVNQWVFVAPEDAVCGQEGDELEPVFIKIPHPRTGNEQQFLLSHSGEKIFEVLKFTEEPRSWFIEDSVQKDGSLFVITPVDPLFLVLPYLTKYSQKVEQTANSLSQSGVHVSKGSQSATFVRSRRHTDASRSDFVRYAFGLVSEYLSLQWSERLKESLGITDEPQLSSPEGPPTKRAKVTDEIPEATEDYSKGFSKLNSKTASDKTTTKLTAAQKSLSKVDKKGMKSISSFFGGAGGKKAKKK